MTKVMSNPDGITQVGKIINPVDAANYLVMLYKQTMYECNKQKLQKLIFIADVLYYINTGYTERMVSETDITATECGICVGKLKNRVYSLVFNFYNERKTIDTTEVDKESKMPLHPKYNYNIGTLDVNVCNVLYKAFIEFGAYSGKDLTLMSQALPIWGETKEKTTNNITIAAYKTYFNTTNESDFIDELKQIISGLSNSNVLFTDIVREIIDIKKE